MTGRQAKELRPGVPVRRNDGTHDDGEVYIVERIELPSKRGEFVTVYASGHAFLAWEIERVDVRQGWPAMRRKKMNDLSAMRKRYLAIRTEIACLRLDLTAFRDELAVHHNDEQDGFSIVLSDMIAGMEQETDALIAEARDILSHLGEEPE